MVGNCRKLATNGTLLLLQQSLAPELKMNCWKLITSVLDLGNHVDAKSSQRYRLVHCPSYRQCDRASGDVLGAFPTLTADSVWAVLSCCERLQ